jgi:hypothetical protein
MDLQRLVELPAGLQNVGDFAHRDGARAHVADPLIDRQLLLLADLQRLVELASGTQDVGDHPQHLSSGNRRDTRQHSHQFALIVNLESIFELTSALQDVGDKSCGYRSINSARAVYQAHASLLPPRD